MSTPVRPHLPLAGPPAATRPHRRGRVLTRLPAAAAAVTGGLGVLIACAACCVPLLVSAGLVTGAGAAGLENVFLGVGAALMLIAGVLVLVRRRRAQRTGHTGCGDGCAC